MIWGNDNPSKSTKSLRSVSILKLRKILERIDTVEVLFNANRYILQLSEDVYCDYLACLDWLKDKRVRTQPDFEYFYDIINNSGDSELIRKAANLGLDMVINSAKEAAAKAKGGSTTTDSKSDTASSSDSSTSKKSSTKSTTEEDFGADTSNSNN